MRNLATVFTLICLVAPALGFGQQTSTAQPSQDTKPKEKEQWYEIGAQATLLPQTMLPFHSPYMGKNSMPSYLGTRTSESVTAYLGAQVRPGLEVYLDPEWLLGAGLGASTGIAGFPNVEIVRIGVKEIPYIGRAFVRGIIPTGKAKEVPGSGENEVPVSHPADSVVVTFGKLAATDLFDTNTYANSGRTQFMNWALVNNAAYDYDADVRGYTFGGAIEWKHPDWAIRAGMFQMPLKANGPELATNLSNDHGDQAELEWHPTKGSAIRLLGYHNVAHMGNYQDALDQAATTGMPPDITSVERNGEVKYGFGLNGEDALGDDGDTGVFTRLGWNNGETETFAYTECDTTVSFGLQVSGKRWKTPQDHWAIAAAIDGLSASHRDYLAAGGYGFQVGDGKLNYGQEQIVETYYARQFNKYLQGSLDFQLIENPGYNQDRGPIPVVSARLHLEF